MSSINRAKRAHRMLPSDLTFVEVAIPSAWHGAAAAAREERGTRMWVGVGAWASVGERGRVGVDMGVGVGERVVFGEEGTSGQDQAQR